jgi:hypothetical protein
MQMSLKTGRWILFGAVLLAARFCEAGGASNSIAKMDSVPPFPALRAAANANGIPLEGIDPPACGEALGSGDSVTALITLHEKGRRRTQWLIYFQVTDSPKETFSEKHDPMIMYTSTGNKFAFARSPANIRVQTIGPFAESNSKGRHPAFNEKSAQVSVNKDFLSLGFDLGAAAVLRWASLARQKDGADFRKSFEFGPAPFDGSRITRDKKLAAQMQVTPEEEHSVVGWIPALSCYFSTVRQTPNLKGIMLKVLDMPSLWSIVRNGGITAGIGISYEDVRQCSPAGWGLPSGSPVYALPAFLSINDREALNLTMVVATPRPPLLACGGIIGLLAENPEDAENYLTLRIISAHCGAGATETK